MSDTPLSESQRLKYLRHYISDVPKLGAVSTQPKFLKIGLGKPLSADETASVVETMALQLDGTAKQPPGTRRAYVTNIDFSEAGLAIDGEEPSYSANTHNSFIGNTLSTNTHDSFFGNGDDVIIPEDDV